MKKKQKTEKRTGKSEFTPINPDRAMVSAPAPMPESETPERNIKNLLFSIEEKLEALEVSIYDLELKLEPIIFPLQDASVVEKAQGNEGPGVVVTLEKNVIMVDLLIDRVRRLVECSWI